MTEDQLAKLFSVIETKRPIDVGFDVEMNWTSPLIKDYIKNIFDVDYSPAAVKFLIKRLGFRFIIYKLDENREESQKKLEEGDMWHLQIIVIDKVGDNKKEEDYFEDNPTRLF